MAKDLTQSDSYLNARAALAMTHVINARSAATLLQLDSVAALPYRILPAKVKESELSLVAPRDDNYYQKMLKNPYSVTYRQLQTEVAQEYWIEKVIKEFQQYQFIRKMKLAKLRAGIAKGFVAVAGVEAIAEREQEFEGLLHKVDNQMQSMSQELNIATATLTKSATHYNKNVSSVIKSMSAQQGQHNSNFITAIQSMAATATQRLLNPFGMQPAPIRIGSRVYQPGDASEQQVNEVAKNLVQMLVPAADGEDSELVVEVKARQAAAKTPAQVEAQLANSFKELSKPNVPAARLAVPGFKPVPKPSGGVTFVDLRDLQQVARVSPLLREVHMHGILHEKFLQRMLTPEMAPASPAYEQARKAANQQAFLAKKLIMLRFPELNEALIAERNANTSLVQPHLEALNSDLSNILKISEKVQKLQTDIDILQRSGEHAVKRGEGLEFMIEQEQALKHVEENAPGTPGINPTTKGG